MTGRKVQELRNQFFFRFVSQFIDVYSQWTSKIMISLGSAYHIESKTLFIMSLCSDQTELLLAGGVRYLTQIAALRH